MNRDTKIDGWSNYETYIVSLWLKADAASFLRFRDEAREQLRLAARNVEAQRDGSTPREIAARVLAGLIQQFVEEEAPELGVALERVDWQEIAEDLFKDLSPSSQPSTMSKALLPEEF